MTTVKVFKEERAVTVNDALAEDISLIDLKYDDSAYDLDIEIADDVGLTDEEITAEEQASRALFVQMPASGAGFVCYGPEHKRYGRSEVIQTLKKISAEWAKDYPNGPSLRWSCSLITIRSSDTFMITSTPSYHLLERRKEL